MSTPISFWWCCLRAEEALTNTALLAAWLVNPTYMDRSTFDALVAATGLSASTLVLAYFMQHYGLEYQMIPCGEDCFIDAVVFTGSWWPQLAEFALSDDFMCPDGCEAFRFWV